MNYNERIELDKLRRDYNDAVYSYIRYFSRKHGVICDGVHSSTATFGDYWFTIQAIITDVDTNAPKGEIFRFFDEKASMEHD